MPATRAFIVTVATTLALSANALAGEKFSFPSSAGMQLGATPAPTFAQPTIGNSFADGPVRHDSPHDSPPPLVSYDAKGDAGAYRAMAGTLATAAYANYAADYARLFAPGYAVNAWTSRVFGVIDAGYGAVDAWTAEAYGMGRLHGERRGASAPDLTLMPKFGPHPELEQSPVFTRKSD